LKPLPRLVGVALETFNEPSFCRSIRWQPIENLLSYGMWPKFALHSTSATG
jgi:hypothetical protein